MTNCKSQDCNDIKKYILAGVGSIYGLNDIRSICANSNLSINFVETPYMAKYISRDDYDYVFITEDITVSDATVIPLNEYWVSWCTNNPQKCNISPNALEASRSKKYLSDLLKENNVSYNNYHKKEDLDRLIFNERKNIIIKPDNQYSGHGIKILSSSNYVMLKDYIDNARYVDNNVKEILNIESSETTFFEYVSGNEYSADVLYLYGKTILVRLCRKHTTIIDNAPCVLAYVLEEASPDIMKYISAWTNVLFEKNNISFGQFDFILADNGCAIPIDFSCRVGGGIENLLRYTGTNFYANALRFLLSGILSKPQKSPAGIFQLNVIPEKRGILMDSDYGLNNLKCIKYKKRGERIVSIDPSANNRLAVYLGNNFSDKDFYYYKDKLIAGANKIRDCED